MKSDDFIDFKIGGQITTGSPELKQQIEFFTGLNHQAGLGDLTYASSTGPLPGMRDMSMADGLSVHNACAWTEEYIPALFVPDPKFPVGGFGGKPWITYSYRDSTKGFYRCHPKTLELQDFYEWDKDKKFGVSKKGGKLRPTNISAFTWHANSNGAFNFMRCKLPINTRKLYGHKQGLVLVELLDMKTTTQLKINGKDVTPQLTGKDKTALLNDVLQGQIIVSVHPYLWALAPQTVQPDLNLWQPPLYVEEQMVMDLELPQNKYDKNFYSRQFQLTLFMYIGTYHIIGRVDYWDFDGLIALYDLNKEAFTAAFNITKSRPELREDFFAAQDCILGLVY